MSRYDNKIVLKNKENKPYFKGKMYPNIPLSINDIYIITSEGDRLDILANEYYKDPNLWWVISMSNNNINKGSIFPPVGIQLRIPTDINNVIKIFNQFNISR